MQDFLELQPALTLKSHHHKGVDVGVETSGLDWNYPQGSGPHKALSSTIGGSPKSITKTASYHSLTEHLLHTRHMLSTLCILFLHSYIYKTHFIVEETEALSKC